ncbi:hypothetical protein EMCG_03691 [[Emmonsia] crescens]|uniref:Uncharacterized protein n=1 Tax=[Emmonsia] crescens TaxID=73230 RepID=A0A0G2J889_9EURO|nr:hypothetical protein EMCG_03691 [Emmonsia crescens UAMH 3008]
MVIAILKRPALCCSSLGHLTVLQTGTTNEREQRREYARGLRCSLLVYRSDISSANDGSDRYRALATIVSSEVEEHVEAGTAERVGSFVGKPVAEVARWLE